jgi:acyl-CoA synthetase (AMP-forming)/AMP-acid ligase II
MDLSLAPEEQAFADEVRAWLDANLELAPPFTSLAEEVEWARGWQAKLAIKTPERVVQVDELPLLAAGKADRAALRARAATLP